MLAAVAVLTLIANVALIWTGTRRLGWGTRLQAVGSALELLGTVLAVVALGWLGLAVFVGAHVAALVAHRIAGAIYIEAELAAAAAAGTLARGDLARTLKILDGESDLTIVGPRRRAQLVHLLAERARSIDEIKSMAIPIGLLWQIGDRPDLAWLVERFDVILRLYGRDADEAMDTADTITAATQNSAVTMGEMIESMVVGVGGSPTPAAPAKVAA